MSFKGLTKPIRLACQQAPYNVGLLIKWASLIPVKTVILSKLSRSYFFELSKGRSDLLSRGHSVDPRQCHSLYQAIYPLILSIILAIPTPIYGQNEADEAPTNEVEGEQTKAKPVDSDKSSPDQTPEETIASIQSQIVLLNQKLGSFDKISSNQGIGPPLPLAMMAFDQARIDFEQGQYLSTIDNLNDYLNWTQVPDIKNYLMANDLLSQSYQKLNQAKWAIKAAARYLSTIATNPEYSSARVVNTMADLLRMVEANHDPYEIQLNPLMAALTSLELAQQQKAWIYFYAGKSARLTGHLDLGISWLEKAIRETSNSYLVARAHYNRALIYIKMGRYSDAIQDLHKALKEKSEGSFDHRQVANLALARIYIHLRKPKTALWYYNVIDDHSPAYADALFEKTYLYLQQNRPEDAIISAEEFLLRFPNRPDNYQVRSIKAYLDLSNGDIKSASESIKLNNQRLYSISQWLTDNYQNRDTLVAKDINGLIKVTHTEVSQPPLLLKGQKLFHRLQDIMARLDDIRNDVRHSIFTLGRASVKLIKPKWHNRILQLSDQLKEALALGDILIQAETQLYLDRLLPKDRYMLNSSQKRRMKSSSQLASFRQSKGPWREWSNLGTNLVSLTKRFRQVKKLQSELTSMAFLVKTAKITRPRARDNELSVLTHQSKLLESELMRTVEIVRSRQILLTVSMSELQPVKNLVKNISGDLFEELATLSNYRNQYQTPQQKHLSDDLNNTWAQWQHVLTTGYTQLIQLEWDMKKSLTTTLTELDDLIESHSQLTKLTDQTYHNLSLNLGKYLGLILEHYHNQIRGRLANHQKWQADLNWLAFNKTTEEKQKALDKYELEQQILDENLKDLEQGVLTKWP